VNPSPPKEQSEGGATFYVLQYVCIDKASGTSILCVLDLNGILRGCRSLFVPPYIFLYILKVPKITSRELLYFPSCSGTTGKYCDLLTLLFKML